jgi:HAE1 family hydrophobic/amphiphilic exporter-1
VQDGHGRYDAITRGVIRSLDDIREFPVDGRGLKLKDIADIVYDKPVVRNGRHLNGHYAVGLDIRKTSQAKHSRNARAW